VKPSSSWWTSESRWTGIYRPIRSHRYVQHLYLFCTPELKCVQHWRSSPYDAVRTRHAWRQGSCPHVWAPVLEMFLFSPWVSSEGGTWFSDGSDLTEGTAHRTPHTTHIPHNQLCCIPSF
jgi:hypothetical protein